MKKLLGIVGVTLALAAVILADDIARYRYQYIGAGGNFGGLGTLSSNDVISVTENQAAGMTDRSLWLPIDKVVPENPLILSGGAKTLSAYPQLYMLNVTTSIVVLPTAVGKYGWEYAVKMWNVNTGEIRTTSSQKIDGATNFFIGPSNAVLKVMSDNANWWIIGRYP